MPALPTSRPQRIRIAGVEPDVDCGAFRAKRCVGDLLEVSATIFRDGHDVLRAAALYRTPGSSRWQRAPMERPHPERDADRFTARIALDTQGRWHWRIEAWSDHFATWRSELERKLAAGQPDLSPELAEGIELVRGMADGAHGRATKDLARTVKLLEDPTCSADTRTAVLLSQELAELCEPLQSDADAVVQGHVLEIDVERVRARFGSWYELFPRSWGGFEGMRERLPGLAALGFDVIYLPPIHPIGETNRKGRNDALTAAPGDPGSPWSIGSALGGHTAVHPDLGTIKDFDHLAAAAAEHDLELALDFAIQCSADHPWLTEHPQWFHQRPDGSLKYAENPPKRYQDIYNVDFGCADWRGLWAALRDVMLFWVGHGVRIFRVDNPHTKPVAFWDWLIEEVRRADPDVIFLAEAFTRAPMMRELAKVGFSQSYTYFTWKNTRAELTEYVEELARPPVSDYFRPNFFVNTPDILSDYLQSGGTAAFAIRLTLAATLSPAYGIYSGFEHFEAAPRQPGSEEYLNSEKYEVRQRRLDGPLLPFIGMLNRLRRDHQSLRRLENVTFLDTENNQLIAYLKAQGDERLIVVVTLNPHDVQEGVATVPAGSGLPPAFRVVDLLSGETFDWGLGRNYVRLDPTRRVAHILEVAG